MKKEDVLVEYNELVERWREDKKALDGAYKEALKPINEAFNNARDALWSYFDNITDEYEKKYEAADK